MRGRRRVGVNVSSLVIYRCCRSKCMHLIEFQQYHVFAASSACPKTSKRRATASFSFSQIGAPVETVEQTLFGGQDTAVRNQFQMWDPYKLPGQSSFRIKFKMFVAPCSVGREQRDVRFFVVQLWKRGLLSLPLLSWLPLTLTCIHLHYAHFLVSLHIFFLLSFCFTFWL